MRKAAPLHADVVPVPAVERPLWRWN
jgi:hypothetical protein